MNKPITFAIVVPVYNVEKYLRECLESIRNQTYPHFEVFMVDDGSTDSSGKICDEYVALDSRFHIHHKRNGGLSSARNAALDILMQSQQKFQYIAFVDSDDFVALDWLKRIANTIGNKKFDCIVFGYKSFYHSSEIVYSNNFKVKERFNRNIFKHYIKRYDRDELSVPFVWNKIFSRHIFKTLRFDRSLKLGEDQDFFFQSKDLLFRAIYIYQPFYFYRQRINSLVNTIRKDELFWEVESHLYILKKYEDDCIKKYMWRHLLYAYTKKFLKFGDAYSNEFSKMTQQIKQEYSLYPGKKYYWIRKLFLLSMSNFWPISWYWKKKRKGLI